MFHVVSGKATPTNDRLVAALRRLGVPAEYLRPRRAPWPVEPGDVLITRLDVSRSLTGMEAGSRGIDWLARRGVFVINRPAGLRCAHDKLRTAEAMERYGLPHPRTVHVTSTDDNSGRNGRTGCGEILGRITLADLRPPLVLKPRFGSCGRDVVLCRTRREVDLAIRQLSTRPWWARHGAVAQEFVPYAGADLRIVVAPGQGSREVVGAAERRPANGEWRTNVTLGGRSTPTQPPPAACAAALDAIAAIGLDFAGVDLLPVADGGYVILEVNGAVELTSAYLTDGGDVVSRIAAALIGLRQQPIAVGGDAT